MNDVSEFLTNQYEKNKANNQSSRLFVPIGFDKLHPNWRFQAATWARQNGLSLTPDGTYYDGYNFRVS